MINVIPGRMSPAAFMFSIATLAAASLCNPPAANLPVRGNKPSNSRVVGR
jgi:hypothetical protein